MTDVSLTISGSIEEIEEVLELLSQRGLPSTTSGNPLEDPTVQQIQEKARRIRVGHLALGSEEQVNLEDFVRRLSDKGVELVRSLAERSGEEFTAVELTALLSAKEDQFYGIVGSAARVWAKVSSSPSPFTSRPSRTKNAPVWSMDAGLAAKLLGVLRKLDGGPSQPST